MATSSKSSSILICSCIIALLVFHNSVQKSVAARSLPQAPLNANVRLITLPIYQPKKSHSAPAGSASTIDGKKMSAPTPF
ncbi:unnamed protein product [Rhodiola kirilowii]